MNPEHLFLYFLSVVAASATFLTVKEQSETTLFDWIGMGSLVLLMAQIISLAVRPALLMKFSQEVWQMPHSKILKRCAKWIRWIAYAYGLVTIAWPAQVLATTGIGVLPWDQPLNTIQTDLQGTVAHAATTIAVIAAGLTWTFSEHGTGARKMSAVALGGAGALGATQLITALFPFAPALF